MRYNFARACVAVASIALLVACSHGVDDTAKEPRQKVSAPQPSGTVTGRLIADNRGPTHVQDGTHLSNPPFLKSPQAVAKYLTWTYVNIDRQGLFRAAGIKVLSYINPFQPICIRFSANNRALCDTGGNDGFAYNALNTGGKWNSVAAKDCSGKLVSGYYNRGSKRFPALFADPTKPSVSRYLQDVGNDKIAYINYANKRYPHAWDELFIDNVVPVLYNPSATPCGFNTAAWFAAYARAIGVTTIRPYQVNGLSAARTTAQAQQALQILSAPNIATGDFEGCYGAKGAQNIVATAGATFNWYVAEYSEINTVARGKVFWCYVKNVGQSAALVPYRLYTFASFLLSYDYDHAIIETALSGGPSGLNVLPEWQIVPTKPLTTASDVSAYQLPSGVYLRRWRACFDAGANVGPCAVVVNPSNSKTVVVPAGYSRTLVVAGGGVLDGGTAKIRATSTQSLPPATAAIVFP